MSAPVLAGIGKLQKSVSQIPKDIESPPSAPIGSVKLFSPMASNIFTDQNNHTYIKEGFSTRSIETNSHNSFLITSQAEQISQATNENRSYTKSFYTDNPFDLLLNVENKKLCLIKYGSSNVYSFNLTVTADIRTASFGYENLSLQAANPYAIAFSNDGLKFFSAHSNARIYQYTLTTAFDVSSGSYDGVFLSVSSQDGTPMSMVFDAEGYRLFVSGYSTGEVYKYNLSSAFDVSSATYSGVKSSNLGTVPEIRCIRFSNNGASLFVLSEQNQEIIEYELANPFDITEMAVVSSIVVGTTESHPKAIALNGDDSKLLITGNQTDSIHQYSYASNPEIGLATLSDTPTGASYYMRIV